MVTGADGFVGRAVCARLCATGHTVVAGLRSPDLWTAMNETVPAVGCFRVIGDLGSSLDLRGVCDDIEVVMHLAGRVHVMRESIADPLTEFRATNVAGTGRLVREAIQQNVRRFIFVSTVKVHGESTNGRPFSERDPDNPQDPYAVSKWEAEQDLKAIGRNTKLEVVIVRSPLVYGPGVRANFLRLIRLSDSPLPLPIPDTTNRRGLIGVRNLADFLVQCVYRERAANETFLVSDGNDISTRELMIRMGRALGRKVHFLPVPPCIFRMSGALLGRRAEVGRLLDSLSIDSSKARSRLSWLPPVDIDDELQSTARWYRQHCLKQRAV